MPIVPALEKQQDYETLFQGHETLSLFYFILFIYLVICYARDQTQSSGMVGKHSTTEAYHQPIKQNGVQLGICYQKLIE